MEKLKESASDEVENNNVCLEERSTLIEKITQLTRHTQAGQSTVCRTQMHALGSDAVIYCVALLVNVIFIVGHHSMSPAFEQFETTVTYLGIDGIGVGKYPD